MNREMSATYPPDVYIRNVYPPIQDLEPRVKYVVIIFVLCFIVGICGNSSVLTIIRGIVLVRKARYPRRHMDNAILYVAALCVVDFLMSLSLPPAILDSIIGFWMFGTAICKLHHVLGSVGRIVSTFIITAMSFDRYVAVCHPMKLYFRSRKFIVSTITGLWLIAFILLLPMLSYAKANEILLHEVRTPGFMREGENITRVRVYKCSDSLPFSLFLWFTMRVLPRSGIPLRRITTYTILIAVMYFVCWTPYWCSVLYAIYMSLLSDGNSQSSETTLFIIYCFHLLPYIGSASNWILYGLLNTQLNLQKQHESNGQDDVLAAMNNGTAISSGFGLNEAPRKNDRSNSTFFGRVKPSNGNGLTVRDNDRLSLSLSLINFHEDSKDFK